MKLARFRDRISDKGQSTLEAALTFPVLIIVLLGIFDLGRAILAYSTISNAAREGARYGIIHPTWRDSDGVRPYDEYNTIEGHAAFHMTTVDPSRVEIQVCFPPSNYDMAIYDFDACSNQNTDPKRGDPVAVTVRYNFLAATPVISALWGGGNLPLGSRTTMELELPL
ncbi:MAG: TadE family protein [Anaerolineae bacterium]